MYDVLTGEVHNHPANNKYGEVHTGDAWLPARDRYCQNKTEMPVGLIVSVDKSGALSLPQFYSHSHSSTVLRKMIRNFGDQLVTFQI